MPPLAASAIVPIRYDRCKQITRGLHDTDAAAEAASLVHLSGCRLRAGVPIRSQRLLAY